MPITKASGQAVAPAAKGDLVVGSATNDAAVLGVGSANQVLTVDSSTTTGLKWATPSAGGMTLISSGTASGNTITFSSIPQTYQDLRIQVVSARNTTSGGRQWNLRINSNSGAIYYSVATILPNWTQGTSNNANTSVFDIGHTNTTADNDCYTDIMLYNYTAANINRSGTYFSVNNANPNAMRAGYWFALDLNAITSIQLIMQDSENWAGGTYYLYGVK